MCGESNGRWGGPRPPPSTSSRGRNNLGFARKSGKESIETGEAHDSDYFRQRAAEARAAARSKGRGEQAAVAGELALAYAALARRRAAADAEALIAEVPPAEMV
jgi:hypothetical protein